MRIILTILGIFLFIRYVLPFILAFGYAIIVGIVVFAIVRIALALVYWFA